MFPDFLLTQAQAQLAATKDARDAPVSRSHLFSAAALQLCEYFGNHPTLESFQFTTVLQLEDVTDGLDRTFKQRHHVKVVTAGQSSLLDADAKTRFFYEATPFWLMGNGSFTVQRSSPVLQDLLAAEPGSDDKRVKAYALALELDASFQRVSHECYLGEVL